MRECVKLVDFAQGSAFGLPLLNEINEINKTDQIDQISP